MRINAKKQKVESGKQKLFLFSVFCFVFCLTLAADQQQGAASTMKGFRAPLEYFDPPHELQVKSFLESTEAEPKSDGLVLLRGAKLQTFKEDGTREMVVTTPQCFFDAKEHTVNSAGPLQVETTSEKAIIVQQGEGFLWKQTNSDLIISNQVHTTIRPLTNSLTR